MPSGWLKNADRRATSKKDRAGGGKVADVWSLKFSNNQFEALERLPPAAAGKTMNRRATFMEETPSVSAGLSKSAKKRAKKRAKAAAAKSHSGIRAASVEGKGSCYLWFSAPNNSGGDLSLTAAIADPVIWPHGLSTPGQSVSVKGIPFYDLTNPNAARRFQSPFGKNQLILVRRCPNTNANLQLKRCVDAGAKGCIFVSDIAEKLVTAEMLDCGESQIVVANIVPAHDSADEWLAQVITEDDSHSQWELQFIYSNEAKMNKTRTGDTIIHDPVTANDESSKVFTARNPQKNSTATRETELKEFNQKQIAQTPKPLSKTFADVVNSPTDIDVGGEDWVNLEPDVDLDVESIEPDEKWVDVDIELEEIQPRVEVSNGGFADWVTLDENDYDQ